MKKKLAFLAVIVVIFSLVSCDDFFSTSWGEPRKFDDSNISIDPGNVDQWVAKAVADPDLAEAVAKAISKEVKNRRGRDQAKLAAAGAKLAVESSHLSEAIFSGLSDVVDMLKDDNYADILDVMLSGFGNEFKSEAADILAEIVGSCIEEGNPPKFNSDFAAEAQPADALMAVVVLAISVAQDIDWDNIEDPDYWAREFDIDIDEDGNIDVRVDNPVILAMAAYLDLFANDEKFSGSSIGKNIFGDLF